MSCKDILPQVKIDGIAIKQVPWSGPPGGYLPRSFSYSADEIYDIGISHTNMIQVDSFLGAFSFGDLLNATVDTPSLYNIKFLFTDDPQTYTVIQDAIKLIDEVSFFLHGDGATATSEEVTSLKKKIDNTKPGDKPPAPPPVTKAVETLNKCTFKLVKKKSTSGDDDYEAPQEEKQDDAEESKGDSSQETKLTPKVKTLIDNIIDALTDNTANSFTPTQDKIFSFVKSLEVDQKKITYEGEPLVATVTNSQITADTFYDTQLKNLYMIVVPNIEYRENNKLVFTVRQYVTIPLVLDYQPQPYGTTTNGSKEVSLDFIKQSPYFNTDKLVKYWTDEIKKTYGDRAYKTFNQNAKSKAIFSHPITSVGYNGAINGTFFVNMKNLGEKLTVFGATLEQPQLYKGIIENISIKKVYDDGTEVQLDAPTAVNGLSFKEKMVRGYRFTDQYDLQDFKYVISIDAKNPLEKLLQYVMPKLTTAKQLVDAMVQQLVIAKKAGSVTVLNPVSGYFTDDFLGSSYYTVYNENYVQAYQQLYDIYNFLLYGEPFKKNTKKLVNTGQLLQLQQTYDEVINTMQVMAKTEGIGLPTLSSYSTKKKASNKVPYKTLSQAFIKTYTSSTGPVLFDFLYSGQPNNRDGFVINKADLLSRVNFEGQLLNSFGVSETDNTYGLDEAISITPLSIRIDDVSIDLTTYESLEEVEDTTTNVLLAAEIEVKKPSSVFKGETDTFVKLLELENATVVVPDSKTLKAQPRIQNFFPRDFPNLLPATKAKKLTSLQTALSAMFKALAKKAQEELGKQAAKALFLNEANAHPLVLAILALQKAGWYTGNAIDYKHSLLNRNIPGFPEKNMFNKDDPNINTAAANKAMEVIAPFYKQAPATVMTRFMNSYQLEYVADFDLEPFEPVYKPLTKNVINGILPNSSIIAVLKMKAGAPIGEGYTEMHESFMIGDITPLSLFPEYDFLPNIKISSTGIISPSAVKIEQVSKDFAAQKAQVFETATGAMGEQNFDAKFAGVGQPAPQPKKKKEIVTPRAAPKTRSKTKKKPSIPKQFNPDAGLDTGPGGY